MTDVYFRFNGFGVLYVHSIRLIALSSSNSLLEHLRFPFKDLAHWKAWTAYRNSKFIEMIDRLIVYLQLILGKFFSNSCHFKSTKKQYFHLYAYCLRVFESSLEHWQLRNQQHAWIVAGIILGPQTSTSLNQQHGQRKNRKTFVIGEDYPIEWKCLVMILLMLSSTKCTVLCVIYWNVDQAATFLVNLTGLPPVWVIPDISELREIFRD